MNEEEKQRLLELLSDQAAFGLSDEEASELRKYSNQFPEWEDDDSFELAAAAINLVSLDTSEPLPENLRKRVALDAEQFFAAKEKTEKVLDDGSKAKESVRQTEVGGERKRPFWQWLGWAVAAAACLMLAVNLWLTRFPKQSDVVKNPETIQTPPPKLTAAQKREQFLASTADKIQTNWTEAKPNGSELSGDVVWSNTKQEGYIRFRGLPVNDPNKETYQLWIVDENQDEKTPIDGGVFDVNEKGEIIIPINAKIAVKKPKMFAVTVEKPGGVVVSKQEKVVAIAKV